MKYWIRWLWYGIYGFNVWIYKLSISDDKGKFYRTIVIYSEIEKRIIGAGTIIIVHKIHNSRIGQIEDIIISEKYRKNGFGKQIIQKWI